MKADKSMQRRHWLMGGVALAAVAGGGIYAWQATRDMRSNDEAVDAFWALQLQQPDGQMLALQSLRGRPLLVNFWATWCPPCVRELPMLDRFAQEQAQRGSQGVQMLGLAVDQAASEAFPSVCYLTGKVGFNSVKSANFHRRICSNGPHRSRQNRG